MSIDKLKALALVKKNAADAKKQLLSYKTSLQKKYVLLILFVLPLDSVLFYSVKYN